MGVQALSSKGSIEAFYERIVGGFAGTREVDLPPIPVCPEVHGLTGELAAIVAKQHRRYFSVWLQPVQSAHDIVSS
jgi:hypothetical protein